MKNISMIVKDTINLILASIIAFIFGTFFGIGLILYYEEDTGLKALDVINRSQKMTKNEKTKKSVKNKIGYDVSSTEVKS